MKPSSQLIGIGVGVLLTFSLVDTGVAQSDLGPLAVENNSEKPSLEASPTEKNAATEKNTTIDSEAEPESRSPALQSGSRETQKAETQKTGAEKAEAAKTGTSEVQAPKAEAPKAETGTLEDKPTLSTVAPTPPTEPLAVGSFDPTPVRPSKPSLAKPPKPQAKLPKPNSRKPGSRLKPLGKTTQPAIAPNLDPTFLAPIISQSSDPSSSPSPGQSPVTPISPTFPNTPIIPGLDNLVPTKPIGPAKPGVAPDYLNPDPNPLSFPTKPEEVKLQGIQPITLEQAIELAKRNNRDLQLAEERLKRSRAVLREQQAALYPTVRAQGNITQSQSAGGQLSEEAAQKAQEGIPRRFRSGVNVDKANLALSGTVEVGYDIYTSGRRPAQIRAAERQMRSDELQVEVALEQLRLDVATAYYNLQQADEGVRIGQSAVRNAEASLRDAQALERAGLGTRFDVLRSQVQLANSQQDLTRAFGQQQIRRRELAQTLAVSSVVDLAAADPVRIAGKWDIPLEQTILLAFKNRAELEQLLAQREAAQFQKKVALAALGPTVSLSVQYNVLNNLRDNLGFGDGYSVTAGMNWNIFDGGAAQARASQQDANIATVETQFAQSRERIRLQVETAYSTLTTSLQNIETNKQALVQAREALRLARLRFQAGVGTQTEVINSENDLTRAEGNLVTAILDYNRALASLTRSVTNLPIPTGSTVPTIPKPGDSTL
jgi:OMF family outer membrane factor